MPPVPESTPAPRSLWVTRALATRDTNGYTDRARAQRSAEVAPGLEAQTEIPEGPSGGMMGHALPRDRLPGAARSYAIQPGAQGNAFVHGRWPTTTKRLGIATRREADAPIRAGTRRRTHQAVRESARHQPREHTSPGWSYPRGSRQHQPRLARGIEQSPELRGMATYGTPPRSRTLPRRALRGSTS